MTISDDVVVQAAQRRDEVLDSAATTARVAAHDHLGADVLSQLLDLRRGGLIQTPVAPMLDDPPPVRAAARVADSTLPTS
jgi:hypothetical protein